MIPLEMLYHNACVSARPGAMRRCLLIRGYQCNEESITWMI